MELYMMRKSIFGILILSVIITCASAETYAENQYLELVNNYNSAQELAIEKIPLHDSRYFYFYEDKFFINFSDICGTSIYIADSESNPANYFQFGYNLSEYYLKGIYKTKLGNNDALIITHYIPGSTGWTSNVIVLHVFTKMGKSYYHQKLSTFFSGIDSIADLDHDGFPEFICLNLVLDLDGAFVVPILFSLDERGLFLNKMTDFYSVPALIDRHNGLVRLSWDSVPESVINAADISIPVVK